MPEVLLVEDDAAARRVLATALEDDGFTVREAEDGASALRALQDRTPDCLVLDLTMPRVDGHGVLRAMRTHGFGTRARVLLLTGDVDVWDDGADDSLATPYDATRVGVAVRDLLAAAPGVLDARRAAERQRAELVAKVRRL